MATPTSLPGTVAVGDLATAAYANSIRGAFRVLQVVSQQFTTQFDRSTNTYADCGISLAITTQSNTSKIFVIATIPCLKEGNTQSAVCLKLVRASTDIKTTELVNYTDTSLQLRTIFADNFLDSPATLGAITYKYQLRNFANAASVAICPGSQPATLTLFEISA